MANKEIIIENEKISYTLKKFRRQKRVSFIFHNDGSLVVTIPFSISQKRAEEIIKENSEIIAKNLKKIKETEKVPVLKDAKQVKKARNFAKLVVENKLIIFNAYYNFCYKKISIRDQKTRWGSCSSSGCLSFNYKIIYLSDKLREYIVVHELCHLKEMNHSVNFWNLVAEKIPDFKERRKELKNFQF